MSEFWSALFDYTKEDPDVSLKETEETRFWLPGQSNQELLWVSIGADGSFGFAVWTRQWWASLNSIPALYLLDDQAEKKILFFGGGRPSLLGHCYFAKVSLTLNNANGLQKSVYIIFHNNL